MRHFSCPLLVVPCLWLCLGTSSHADPTLLTWDGTPSTLGVIDNVAGTWTNSPSPTNWYNGASNQAWDPTAIAQFGSLNSTLGAPITINEAITVAGINFLPLTAPLTGDGFVFNTTGGGSINFGSNATISLASNVSNSSGRYVRFNLPLIGSNLTVAKADGPLAAFFDIGTLAASPNLTGTLTLKSSPQGGGIFAVIRPATIPNVSEIIVENGSTLFLSTANAVFTARITASGITPAIRVDSNGNTFTGQITLSGNVRFQTGVNVVTTAITSAITEPLGGGAKNFIRTATVAANSLVPLTMTYSGASNYTGTTTFGIASTLFSATDVVEGGANILNFASPTAPDNDIFYNNVAANTLSLIGGVGTATTLKMIGAVNETNSQTFWGLILQGSTTGVEVISDLKGTANLNLGAVTRSAYTTFSIRGPVSGSINATYGGSPDTFMGPWATYIAGDGINAGWASLVAGKVSLYTGNLDYVTGTAVGVVPGYAAAAHLRVSSTSTGAVTSSGITNIATVSMIDAGSPRTLDIGNGNTLRLAALGGIQMIKGAQALTVGALGDTSVLTAGGTAINVAGELYLTNQSVTNNLTIHSQIRNNGNTTGAVTLILNGTGRTILTGANDFSGHVIINSGVLEVRNNAALGVAAAASLTKIITGAALYLPGGILLPEGLQVNGQGIALDGAIRSLGSNTISGAIYVQSASRIASDSGLLTLSGGIVGQTTSMAVYFSGAGNTEITGLITGNTPILNKEGSGTLTISASSTNAIATVSNGTLVLNFSGATAPASNILLSNGSGGNSLNMSNSTAFRVTGKAANVNTQAFASLNFTSAGKFNLSAVQNGATSLNINFAAITRVAGSLVQFESTALAGFTSATGTVDALLTGAGGVAFGTFGLDDWAATKSAAKNIVGLSTITGGYNTASLSGNADVGASTSISVDTAVSSLRFNTNTGGLLTLGDGAGGTKYLTTGGILVTPAVGANDILISAGALRPPAAAPDLVIIQNNTLGALRISSRITNNASSTPGAVTVVKSGLGLLIMEVGVTYNTGTFGGAYYTNGTRILEGTVKYVSTLAPNTTLLYPVYSAGDFILGSGTSSAKLIVGSGAAAINLWGGLGIDGIGTTNTVVAGSSTMSGFTHHKETFVRDFRKGMIGGTGQYDNNLTLTLFSGTLQLGPSNTYAGKTTITKQFLEVEKLAITGEASSLGTGNFDAGSSIIDLAVGTGASAGATVSGTLRYIGSENSVTNRVINLTNSGNAATNTTYVIGNVENTGTGTVKFTTAFTAGGTNAAQRTLVLGGTNTGDNEIAGMGDATSAPTAPGVKVEKTGVGTWIMTGASTYSGGTTVSAGALLVKNSNMVGSATGTGAVSVAAGSTLGGSGRIAPAVNKSITIVGGTLSVGVPSSASAGVLQLATSGTGTLSLDQNATIALDLFSGVGLDNTLNPAAADMLAVGGTLNLGSGTILKVSNPNSLTGFTQNDQWKLFDWSGLTEPVIGTFATVDLPTLSAGLQWDLSNLYTTGILSMVAVPEPSRAVLIVGFISATMLRRRRPATI